MAKKGNIIIVLDSLYIFVVQSSMKYNCFQPLDVHSHAHTYYILVSQFPLHLGKAKCNLNLNIKPDHLYITLVNKKNKSLNKPSSGIKYSLIIIMAPFHGLSPIRERYCIGNENQFYEF